MAGTKGRKSRGKKIRYAVVGQGYISQAAVLPAFEHAGNSELVALVSDDPVKLRALSRKYGVKRVASYDEYDELLSSGLIDAVYIALPNHLHREYSVRASRAGIHVLCEKPMAVSSEDCRQMLVAAAQNDTRLMIAYRLHFEEANLSAVEMLKKKQIGEAKLFSSVFSFPIKPGNVRLNDESKGGGPVYDIGIYCINASRYLFRDEPIEVSAFAERTGRRQAQGVMDSFSVLLRFPKGRLATFSCSFSAAGVSRYQVVGTKGDLLVDNAYELAEDIEHCLTLGGRTKEKVFRKRDQFAPLLLYFSDCILKNREPEPSGWEGFADIRIIEAIYESIRKGAPVRLEPFKRTMRPSIEQEIEKPAVKMPKLIHAEEPSGKAA